MINPRRLTATLLTAALAVTTLTTPPATALSSVAGSSLSSLGYSSQEYAELQAFRQQLIDFLTNTQGWTITDELNDTAEAAKNNTDLGDPGGSWTNTIVQKIPKDKVDDFLDKDEWGTAGTTGLAFAEDDDYFYVFRTSGGYITQPDTHPPPPAAHHYGGLLAVRSFRRWCQPVLLLLIVLIGLDGGKWLHV